MIDEEPQDRKALAKLWGRRIEKDRAVHREKVVLWAEKVFKEYGGDFNMDAETGDKYDQVAQVIHSVEETIQPHLMFSSPKFSVEAAKPEWEKREPLVEAVINHEYRDILPSGRKLEFENELCILDARLLPYGGTKTSYEVEGDILQDQENQKFMDKMKGLLTGETAGIQEIPVITSEKGHVTERFNPLKVFIDSSATHISKQKWTIEEIDFKAEDLKKPRYEQDKVEKLEANVTLDEKKVPRLREMKDMDDNQKGYRLYEIHDLEKRVKHTYSEQLKDFIEFNSAYPIPEGSQYSFVWFVEVPNQAYPVPPIRFYRQRAKEFSYVYSQVAKQIDKFMPKIGVDSTKLGPADKERLKSGNLASIFETIGPPSNVVHQFIFGIQKELFEYLGALKELMNLESGSNEYELANPEQRKATEAIQIKQGTTARRFKPKKRVKDFLINQAHTILMTLQEFQTLEKFTKVIGENDALEWWQDPETGKQSWTKEDIAGGYSFDFDVETIAPQDENLKKQQNAVNMETALRPELRQGLLEEGIQLKVAPVFEIFAKENMGIKDKSKIMQPLDGLEPGDEHTLWMTGQVPEISERERKDPKFLKKHSEAHRMMILSPGFQSLPPEFQQGPISHSQATDQELMMVEAKMNPQGPGDPLKRQESPQSNIPSNERFANAAMP